MTRLGTGYVDLYQIHRFDPETPVEETMEALQDVVKAGKARYIGASLMWAWQFAKMQHAADTPREPTFGKRAVGDAPHALVCEKAEHLALFLALHQVVLVLSSSPTTRSA